MTRLAAALLFTLYAAAASADPAAESQALAAIERGDTPAFRDALLALARATTTDEAALFFAGRSNGCRATARSGRASTPR